MAKAYGTPVWPFILVAVLAFSGIVVLIVTVAMRDASEAKGPTLEQRTSHCEGTSRVYQEHVPSTVDNDARRTVVVPNSPECK